MKTSEHDIQYSQLLEQHYSRASKIKKNQHKLDRTKSLKALEWTIKDCQMGLRRRLPVLDSIARVADGIKRASQPIGDEKCFGGPWYERKEFLVENVRHLEDSYRYHEGTSKKE